MSELANLSSLIQELIKHKISSITPASKMLEIARIPLSLYRQAQKIFKNEAQVRKIMQQLLQKKFYVKIVDEESQRKEFKQESSLVAQLYEASDKISFYLIQINLRLLFLGLSLSADDKNVQKSKQGMKKLIKNLQIDIVLNSQLTFSQTIIQQLQQFLQDFPHLDFLQQSLSIFEKCNIFHITQWLQNKILQKRQAFEAKMKESQAKLPEIENNLQVRSIRRKNIVKKDENKITNESEEKNKMNSQTQQASVKQLIGYSRKSVNLGSSTGKINKFIFRSSKKPSMEICESSEKQISKVSSSKQKTIQEAKVSRFIVQSIHEDEQTEQSKALCRGTPPQKKRQFK